ENGEILSLFRQGASADSRTGNHHVNLLPRELQKILCRLMQGISVTDIRHIDTVLAGQAVGQRLEFLLTPPEQTQAGALSRVLLGQRFAQTAAGTRDKDRLHLCLLFTGKSERQCPAPATT